MGKIRLTNNIVALLKSTAKPIKFVKGSCICKEGSVTDSVFVILKGTVVITKKSQGDQDIVLARDGGGSIIGEMGAFMGNKRSASVFAEEDVIALKLTVQAFMGLVFKTPELVVAVLESFVGVIANLNEKFSNMDNAALINDKFKQDAGLFSLTARLMRLANFKDGAVTFQIGPMANTLRCTNEDVVAYLDKLVSSEIITPYKFVKGAVECNISVTKAYGELFMM